MARMNLCPSFSMCGLQHAIIVSLTQEFWFIEYLISFFFEDTNRFILSYPRSFERFVYKNSEVLLYHRMILLEKTTYFTVNPSARKQTL